MSRNQGGRVWQMALNAIDAPPPPYRRLILRVPHTARATGATASLGQRLSTTFCCQSKQEVRPPHATRSVFDAFLKSGLLVERPSLVMSQMKMSNWRGANSNNTSFAETASYYTDKMKELCLRKSSGSTNLSVKAKEAPQPTLKKLKNELQESSQRRDN